MPISIPYTAEILTIGAELLKGSTLNTNARFLGKELTHLGFRVISQTACEDSIPAIEAGLRQALSRSDVIFLTGGLGPTPDDVTREAIASYFKVPLILSKSQYSTIRKYYRRHYPQTHRGIPAHVQKEALYPKNAVPLINRFGIALGFYIRHGRQWIMVLPGVPTELEKMFHQLVRPLLRQHFPGLGRKPELVVKIAGMSEPEIMTRLGDDFFKLPFEFGIYPELGEVSIRICAEQEKVVRSLRKKIKKRLGDSIYAWEDTPLAEITGRILSGKKKSVAVAESCTGGGFSSQLTTVSEASRYFKGGVVVYSNALKERLGVSKSLLRSKGAVSEEVAVQLAEKAREFAKTTYGIGITGVAGPTGGSKRKPVGLVYIAVAAPRYTKGWKQLFWGDRHQVQAKASKKALEYLWREIR